MKKTIKLAVLTLFTYSVISCTENSLNSPNPESNKNTSGAKLDGELKRCVSVEVLEENMKEDPGLRGRMQEIEDFTERFVKSKKNGRVGVDQVITIPVVINVLYNTPTRSEFISDIQIQSQIDVLNKDFSSTNSDLTGYTGMFKSVSSDYKIVFVQQGVTVERYNSKASWGTRDAMKSSKKGGINPTTPTTALNMWVCTIGGGILGYAQFPGGNINTDGIVIDPKYFGLSGAAGEPYNLGRTATHEIGHWLNLRHIWGDANCGNDFVADTPTHNTANYGCPALDKHPSTCAGAPIEMTQNYMDYTDDACMFMFTGGQRVRSRAIFEPGGPRVSFNP